MYNIHKYKYNINHIQKRDIKQSSLFIPRIKITHPIDKQTHPQLIHAATVYDRFDVPTHTRKLVHIAHRIPSFCIIAVRSHRTAQFPWPRRQRAHAAITATACFGNGVVLSKGRGRCAPLPGPRIGHYKNVDL